MGNRTSSACFDEDSALIPTMCGGGGRRQAKKNNNQRTDKKMISAVTIEAASTGNEEEPIQITDSHDDDIIHLEDLDLTMESKSNDMQMMVPAPRRGTVVAARETSMTTRASPSLQRMDEDRDEQPVSKPNKDLKKKKKKRPNDEEGKDHKSALEAALADAMDESDGSDDDETRSANSSCLSLGFQTTTSGSVNRDARIDMGTSRCSTEGRDECSSFMEGSLLAAQTGGGRARTRGLPPLGRRLEDSTEQDP